VRILIVEDNGIAAKIATKFFTELGCETEHVLDGRLAVDVVTQLHDHYDGIYMDIGIPIVTGTEACREIRKYEAEHPEIKLIPILAVTANYSSDDAREYIIAGMQTVFYKPLTLNKAKDFIELCKQPVDLDDCLKRISELIAFREY